MNSHSVLRPGGLPPPEGLSPPALSDGQRDSRSHSPAAWPRSRTECRPASSTTRISAYGTRTPTPSSQDQRRTEDGEEEYGRPGGEQGRGAHGTGVHVSALGALGSGAPACPGTGRRPGFRPGRVRRGPAEVGVGGAAEAAGGEHQDHGGQALAPPGRVCTSIRPPGPRSTTYRPGVAASSPQAQAAPAPGAQRHAVEPSGHPSAGQWSSAGSSRARAPERASAAIRTARAATAASRAPAAATASAGDQLRSRRVTRGPRSGPA